jgi:hypothetical protein
MRDIRGSKAQRLIEMLAEGVRAGLTASLLSQLTAEVKTKTAARARYKGS